MTNKATNLITVGRITGVFGIKGWLKVKSWTEPEEQIVEYSPWWLKTRHGVKDVEIEEFNLRPQGLIVRIKGIDDRNAAEELGRVDVAIEKSQLATLDDGDYYWHQLEGLNVVSQFAGKEYRLGQVASIMETGANDVLVVKPGDQSMDDKERLIPYVPDIYVKQVDVAEHTITVEWDPDF